MTPSVVVLTTVILGGGAILFAVAGGRWTLFDAIYMSVNAAATAGFRELDGIDQVPSARGVTIGIVMAGLASVAYFQSTLTALLVEGVIGEGFRVRRMQKRVKKLTDHIIVAGAGSTGMHVIEELHAAQVPFLAIDSNVHRLEQVSRDLTGGTLVFVVGDATQDTVLIEAGIARCRGVVAALTEDKDNLFVTLSARSLNSNARIVTKVISPDTTAKMVRAGANSTVSPNIMGGRRLASEIVRPTVVEFIDQMLLEREKNLRFEEVTIVSGSFFIGRTLREVPIRTETNLLVVALRIDGKFIYNPDPSVKLETGSVLVVLGETKNVARLRELVAMREAPIKDAVTATAI